MKDDPQPEHRFWRAVVEQAIYDLLKPEVFKPTAKDQSNALAWIRSEHRGIASFMWACEQGGLDPRELKIRVKELLEGPK